MTITDEMIEAAAKAIYESGTGNDFAVLKSWIDEDTYGRARYEHMLASARAALAAVLPMMQEKAVLRHLNDDELAALSRGGPARLEIISSVGEIHVDGWQPIETAPKDATERLIFGKWEGEIGDWSNEPPSIGVAARYNGVWHSVHCDYYSVTCNATHWHPLPPPPKGDGT